MTLEEFRLALQAKGLSLNAEKLAKFKEYARLLKEWNEKINLTSIVEEEEVIEKHFLDSALPFLGFDLKGKKVLDIGSGAGFPGMVIALLFDEAEVHLLDATKKKFLFLEEVQKTLQIPNVFFEIGRVEERKDLRESFDFVTARGFAATRVFLEVGAPLCKVKGTLLAMKSRRGEEEYAEARPAMKKLGLILEDIKSYELPSGEVRNNYRFGKAKPTDPRYPRDWATIMRKPL